MTAGFDVRRGEFSGSGSDYCSFVGEVTSFFRIPLAVEGDGKSLLLHTADFGDAALVRRCFGGCPLFKMGCLGCLSCRGIFRLVGAGSSLSGRRFFSVYGGVGSRVGSEEDCFSFSRLRCFCGGDAARGWGWLL